MIPIPVHDESIGTLVRVLGFICSQFVGTELNIVADNNYGLTRGMAGIYDECPGVVLWSYEQFKMSADFIVHCRHTGGCSIFLIISNSHFDEILNKISIIGGAVAVNSKLKIGQVLWTKEDSASLRYLGWWRYTGNGTNSWTSQNWPIAMKSYYRNFNGRKLRVANANSKTWFSCPKTYTDHSGCEGIDFQQVKYLSRRLNFSFEIIREPNKVWGGVTPSGNITGIIGMVARHEVELSVNSISITASRETVVDFSYPYYTVMYNIFSKAPGIANMAFVVISPFTIITWVSIFISLAIVAWISKVLHENGYKIHNGIEDTEHSQAWHHILNVFRIIVHQGHIMDNYLSSLRILLAFILYATIIVTALYSGGLASVLTSPSYETPVDTLEQAVNIFETTNIYPASPGGAFKFFMQVHKCTRQKALAIGSFPLHRCQPGETRVSVRISLPLTPYIQKSTGNIFSKIHKHVSADPERSFVSSKKRYHLAQNGEAIAFNSEISTKIYIPTYTNQSIYIGKEKFFPQWYGIATPSGCPYLQVLDQVLIQEFPFGLINKWENDVISDAQRWGRKHNNFQGYGIPKSDTRDPISLYQLQAAFFILSGGICLAILMMFFEIALSKYLKDKARSEKAITKEAKL